MFDTFSVGICTLLTTYGVNIGGEAMLPVAFWGKKLNLKSMTRAGRHARAPFVNKMSFQIETGRLVVRDVREDDIPVLVKHWIEPEAKRNILSFQADEEHNRKDLKNAIAWAKVSDREFYKLSVALKNDRTLIGSCILSFVKRESHSAQIGWHFGHRFRGNGYATEAAHAMLYIGFKLRNVATIHGDCFVENKASIRIFEKLGMNPVWNLGLFNVIRGWSYGESRPAVRYTISREDWIKRNPDLTSIKVI